MQHGICLLSVIPCRRNPSGTSEMVTQLLFGETYELLPAENPPTGWLRIRTTAEGYECWIGENQFTPLSAAGFKEINSSQKRYVSDLVQVMHNRMKKTSFPVTIGASLPLIKDGVMAFDNHIFGFDGNVTEPGKGRNNDLLSTAFVLMNAPYLWGGRMPFGIDCSGFTQLVFRLNGYQLPRDAYQQVENGEPLSFVEEALPGDLAFFDNEEGRITHVGITIGNGQIIHASGRVRIDRLDHYGIYSEEARKYTHSLRVIKRVLR